jgi:Zn-dependent peptidase ImmA (M78 family)
MTSTKLLIKQVVWRLPKDVQDKIDSMKFLILEYEDGIHFYINHIKNSEHLIIINDSWMKTRGKTAKYRKYVIAHEIAHAVLGHDENTCRTYMEAEADRLAAQWGFTEFDQKVR